MNIIDKNLSFRNASPHNNTPKEIILHHTECNGWTVERLHSLHKDSFGWSGIGYHYYIRKDGSIYKCRPDWTIGAHCKGANNNSLGIAFEGRYHDQDKSMPQEQFKAGLELIQYLKNQYGNMPIYGHRERGSSDCPGRYFPLEDFRNNKGHQGIKADVQQVTSKPKDRGKSELIKRLQQEINNQGFGSISVDGIAGPNTLNSSPTCKRGAIGNITKIIQEMLINMGYINFLKPYGADGVFGQGTEDAISSFQKRYGLNPDGIIGRNTWDMFFKKLN